MDFRPEKLDPPVGRIEATLTEWVSALPPHRRPAVERWLGDAAALRFHLAHGLRGGKRNRPPLVAIVGGTGAGKSTLVNRLIGTNLTATSFRRTFTAGPVVIVARAQDLPDQWLGWEHWTAKAEDLPVRGQDKTLIIVVRGTEAAGDARAASGASTAMPTLIDTPDLDGDTPAHHAVADRVFRWVEAVVFAVTPEKYQMTELPPYYRLAKRYGVPSLFVMNKCEEAVVAEDYQQQLATQGLAGVAGESPQRVFIIPRDESGYEPPAPQGLAAFRAAVTSLDPAAQPIEGLRNRAGDVLNRLRDQVLAPLSEDRKEIDRLISALHGMEAPVVGVNVNPITQQLQRRLQQRSVLYLIGPQRVLERVRQAPALLARLPRTVWDWFRTGELSGDLLKASSGDKANQPPDFNAVLSDQFAVVQSRIDDIVRGSPATAKWIDAKTAGAGSYAATRFDPREAGKIAEQELADLKAWLEARWNANPRDTRMIQRLINHLPGGKKLAQWSESAPYLLTIVLVAKGAVFGHLDLIILGGYSIATWIGEKISNEVTGRAKATNLKIEQRFVEMASEQIRRVTQWLDQQAPSRRSIEALEQQAEDAATILG
ncbi:GTPase domain-containing protein [Humisphaera borealis]|uniref:50S ribosome-binding GTPase n=1 Tax=Humisphaera borealis TaxID=2807512 RepID=A0A7M2X3E9_9BACT|nr:GTPase domain-containing protein [Humisphaera borealis]QOV92204.1 50S ribosome-binding GTPase [Humisphaera borealis]